MRLMPTRNIILYQQNNNNHRHFFLLLLYYYSSSCVRCFVAQTMEHFRSTHFIVIVDFLLETIQRE